MCPRRHPALDGPIMVLSRRQEFTVGPQNTEMSSAIAARGFRVISHFGDIVEPFGEQLPSHPGVTRLLRRSWLSYLFGRRPLTARTAEYLARTASLILRVRPARIVAVCEYPLAAAILARYPLDRLAYYPLEVPEAGPGLFNIPDRVVRRYGPRLKYVVIPGEHRAELFMKEYGCRRTYVVYNTVSLERRKAMSDPAVLPTEIRTRLPEKPYVLYQGVLGPETFGNVIVEALGLIARRYPVVVVGGCRSAECRARLDALAGRQGATYLGRLPNHYLHQVRLGGALGICLHNSQHSMINDACTPNKYFDYVSSGVPVVCSPNPALRLWNERYGTGVCVDEVTGEAVDKVVETLMADARHREDLSRRCLEAFERGLHYEGQVTPFLNDFVPERC